MGTNYYSRADTCKLCGVSKQELHIGKSSAGWTFSFHATDEIRSYKDWLNFLDDEHIKIFDEYDREVTLLEFKGLVMNKKDAKFNHTEYCIENGEISSYRKIFLDDEGNSMSEGEFS